MRRALGCVAGAALLLAACGQDEPDDAGEARETAALEAELEDARQALADLTGERDELEEQLRLAEQDEAADDDAPTDEPADDADEPDVDADEPDADTAGPGVQPERERSPEGLTEQLRMLFPPRDAPEEFDPGTTSWQPTDLPDGLQDSYDTLGALAFDLAAAIDASSLGPDQWETTVRVLHDDGDADQAYVAVLSWGFADDSVAGRDLRVTVTGGDGAWSPGGAEERFHCRRGVSDDLCV